MQTAIVMKRLDALPKLSKAGKLINGLFRLMTCRDLWKAAYEKVAQNSGSLTPGIDGDTLDGFSLDKLEALISEVVEGRYRPNPVRRVYIPKSNGKLRPLGIPSIRDRLVQETLRTILETIYEPIFSNHSHGFRPNRSCHTALEHIQKVWRGTKWFVEVDIVGYFDNIDHDILVNLLRKRIADKKIIDLIRRFLEAGYLENWRFSRTYSGTPQGGIVSPILANIYLHELDLFMETWMEAKNKGVKRRREQEWNRLSKLINYRQMQIRRIVRSEESLSVGDQGRIAALKQDIKVLDKARKSVPALASQDPDYRRFRYVRYADDFLIGVIGSKDDARRMMDAVRQFLGNLKLNVSEEKSGIRHASDGVEFLGYDIHTWNSNQVRSVRDTLGRNYTKRNPDGLITLNVPRTKIRQFCQRHGYGYPDTRWGIDRPALINSSEYEIASQFNAEYRGFVQYYALCVNVKAQLRSLQFVVQTSLLKTLANKRHSSLAKVLTSVRSRDGEWYVASRDLGGKLRRVRVWKLRHLTRPSVKFAKVDALPRYIAAFARTDLVDRLFSEECALCGTSNLPVEVHHVRKLKDHVNSPLMAQVRAARQRKRIPLCINCHRNVHAGRQRDLRMRA